MKTILYNTRLWIVAVLFAAAPLMVSCNEEKEEKEEVEAEGEGTKEEATPVKEEAVEATDSVQADSAEVEVAPEEAASEETTAVPVESTPVQPAPVKVEPKEEVVETPAATSAPEMTFEVKEYDFGTITQGDKVNRTFKFTNTGSAPLIISNARASCGCTVPEWPKEPIAPGASSKIDVTFNSRGKRGRQTKSITITTNTENKSEVVYLKGMVNVPETTEGN